MTHFQVVEVTYVDGTVERVPAEMLAGMTGRPSDTAYLVSLGVGLPNIVLLLWLAFDDPYGPFTLVLATMSAVGCALAGGGLWAPHRRFRLAALLLTLIPATAVIAGVAVTIAMLVIFVMAGNPNST